ASPDMLRGKRLFQLPSSRRSVRSEIDDEIRFHLESRVAELTARGLSLVDAREIAQRQYGDLEASRAELARIGWRRHDKQRRREALVFLWQDVRYAARALARRPALSAVTIATLTLGIGANSVMFGVVDQLLLRPPAHVANADVLRQIYFRQRSSDAKSGYEYDETTYYAMVRALRDHVPSFADVVA